MSLNDNLSSLLKMQQTLKQMNPLYNSLLYQQTKAVKAVAEAFKPVELPTVKIETPFKNIELIVAGKLINVVALPETIMGNSFVKTATILNNLSRTSVAIEKMMPPVYKANVLSIGKTAEIFSNFCHINSAVEKMMLPTYNINKFLQGLNTWGDILHGIKYDRGRNRIFHTDNDLSDAEIVETADAEMEEFQAKGIEIAFRTGATTEGMAKYSYTVVALACLYGGRHVNIKALVQKVGITARSTVRNIEYRTGQYRKEMRKKQMPQISTRELSARKRLLETAIELMREYKITGIGKAKQELKRIENSLGIEF